MTDLLELHLGRLVNPIDDSDWLDVRRRARSMRRARNALALLAAAVVLAALLVTPALGIGGRLLDLLEGSPAPPEVQTYFATNDTLRERLFAEAEAAGHRLHDRFSAVVPGEARGVAAIDSADGPIYLWAAPTHDGRQCWLIQAGGDPATGRPYGAGSCDGASPSGAIVPDIFWTHERPSVRIVHVRVYDDAITRVDVETRTGDSLSLTVASGHALGTLPDGVGVAALVGRDADGAVRYERLVP